MQSGTDVTLIAYGNTVELAQEVAAKSGVSCEILDLRSIVPLDREAIRASIETTGRAVVVSEDIRTAGFGESVVPRRSRATRRSSTSSSPRRSSWRARDVPIGYNPILEYAALPDEGRRAGGDPHRDGVSRSRPSQRSGIDPR